MRLSYYIYIRFGKKFILTSELILRLSGCKYTVPLDQRANVASRYVTSVGVTVPVVLEMAPKFTHHFVARPTLFTFKQANVISNTNYLKLFEIRTI